MESKEARYKRLDLIQKIDAYIWVIFFVTGIPIYIYEEYFDNSNNDSYVGIILYLVWGAILAITMIIFIILDHKLKKLKEDNIDEEKKA